MKKVAIKESKSWNNESIISKPIQDSNISQKVMHLLRMT